MQYGALRGASFVVGATCEWGLSEKITKAAQKLKPCFRSHYDNAGSLAVYCDFIGIKTHYRV
jgi:hypothetical protein